MAEQTKNVPVLIEVHGDLAELVGRKKKAQLQTGLQYETNRALRKHIKLETNKLAS